jgi:hypothetical protein
MARRVTVTTKRWFESRTVWLNVIGFVLGMLSLTEFMMIIPQSWGPYIAAVVAILNFALRYFTVSPIGIGADKAAKRT